MQGRDTVDGLNVQGLRAAMDAIKESPELARFQFRARNQWVNGTRCRTVIEDFYGAGQESQHSTPFVLEADEPTVLMGEDRAPNATEALLYALASCLNTTLIYHAALRGVEVDELEIDMEGDLDVRGVLGLSDQVRNGFESIRATFRVKSDASREQIEELCRLAQQHSPVYDMVTHQVPVSVQVEIEGAEAKQKRAA